MSSGNIADAVSGAFGPRETVDGSRDELFHILSNARRRRVIRALQDDGPLSVSRLADRLAEFEADGPVTGTDYKRVYTALYQCHIPKLDETGIINADSPSGTARLADSAARGVACELLAASDRLVDDGGASRDD